MKDFSYDFDKAYAYLLENCDRYGITVTEGTGRILQDGKPYDLAKAIHETFSHGISLNYNSDADKKTEICIGYQMNKDQQILFAA